MTRVLAIIFTGFIVSFYWYTVSLRIAPALNLKMALALVGLVILALQIINKRSYTVPKSIFGATIIAAAYSAINLIAVELNDTFDFSYANYITTFFVWIFAGYTVMECIRWVHGKTTINLLTGYSTAVAAFQCILAILIDKFEAIKSLITSIFYIPGQEFFDEIGRLYGLGAALDPAGTRFAVILVMIAFVTVIDEKIKYSSKAILLYLLGFFIIASLGNMISRTTSVGVGFALGVWLLSTGLYRLVISSTSLSLMKVLLPILFIGVGTLTYLYNTDEYTRELLRYGFEGFFNWVEKGEWSTESTNILMEMWKWPEDTKGWIIGTGQFGSWLYGTDIGYCRLILYSGLLGISAFSLLFVYSAYVFITKYRRYRYMFVIFLAFTFIIWAKVSTDLFFIYGLLYVFDDEDEIGYAPKLSF